MNNLIVFFKNSNLASMIKVQALYSFINFSYCLLSAFFMFILLTAEQLIGSAHLHKYVRGVRK